MLLHASACIHCFSIALTCNSEKPSALSQLNTTHGSCQLTEPKTGRVATALKVEGSPELDARPGGKREAVRHVLVSVTESDALCMSELQRLCDPAGKNVRSRE
ncbi:hypothetical protein L1887_50182 [Cichorium endivia]|nr:hypothetical protein L1887_50182 [Cichorium endivia]